MFIELINKVFKTKKNNVIEVKVTYTGGHWYKVEIIKNTQYLGITEFADIESSDYPERSKEDYNDEKLKKAINDFMNTMNQLGC